MARVELAGVSKSWGVSVAVDGMNLKLEEGEFIALLGPSGCGKSTTLFLLAGIYEPTEGDILFDGERINEVEPRDRNVGIVFQSYALYPNMTVLQNLMFPLRFSDTGKAESRRRAQEIAELVQIGPLLDRRPSQLSGGQQQRVALARALIKRPNLLLLDEPLSNLDATLRLTMRTEIKRIQRELGVTTILVTHDQIEATTMADRIICMNTGKIEQIGTAETLYRRPDTAFVAAFVGSPPINLIEGRVEDGRFICGDAELGLSGIDNAGGVLLGIRPELIAADGSGIDAKVETIEPMGREILYGAQTRLGFLRFLEAAPAPRFTAGEQIRIDAEPDDILFFDKATGSRIDSAKLQAFA